MTNHTATATMRVRSTTISDAPIEAADVRAGDGAWFRVAPGVTSAWQAWAPQDGSDADRIVAWPGTAILDTKRGPNRNGRQW